MAREHAARIGARIAAAREEADLTQRELADLIPGKSDGTQVSGWERGEHRVSDDTLDHIARILGKPVAWFHADEPEPGTPDLIGALNGGETQLDRIERLLADVASRLGTVEQRQSDVLNRLQGLEQQLAGEEFRRLVQALEATTEARPAKGRPRRPAADGP